MGATHDVRSWVARELTYPCMSDLAARLSAVGGERAEARERAADASDRLLVLVVEALGAGMSKAEIARRARISLPGLEVLLKRAEAEGLTVRK